MRELDCKDRVTEKCSTTWCKYFDDSVTSGLVKRVRETLSCRVPTRLCAKASLFDDRSPAFAEKVAVLVPETKSSRRTMVGAL